MVANAIMGKVANSDPRLDRVNFLVDRLDIECPAITT